MCGAISGFHALVSSGTTPKMIDKESDIRMIGYGAMLIEGLVGVVALIAAASLPQGDYYDINIDLDAKSPKYRRARSTRNGRRQPTHLAADRSSRSAANRCAAAPAGRSRWPSAWRRSFATPMHRVAGDAMQPRMR